METAPTRYTRWDGKTTGNVRDTAEEPNVSLYILTDNIFKEMDPRRTRDPRLARAQAADPRLQRTTSNSPAPPQAYYNGSSRPGSNTHTPNNPTPPQPFVQAGDTVVQQLATDTSTTGTPQPSPISKYKQRPLFCVVCASNQVCIL